MMYMLSIKHGVKKPVSARNPFGSYLPKNYFCRFEVKLNEDKYYDFTLNRLRGIYSPIYEDVDLIIIDK